MTLRAKRYGAHLPALLAAHLGAALVTTPCRAQEPPTQAAPDSSDPTLEDADLSDPTQFFEMSMDELMSVSVANVSTAGKRVESLAESTSNVTVITAREIELFGGERLIDILDRVVGAQAVSTYISRDQNMALRGQAEYHRDSHTLFLIDGRPVRESLYNGQSAPYYLAFPLRRIARIEVIRGPSSVLYGSNAFLGVINIITKRGAAQETIGQITYGQDNTRRAEVAAGWTRGDLELALGANVLATDGWEVDAVIPDPRQRPGRRHRYPTRDAAQAANLRAAWRMFELNATYAEAKQRVGFSTNPVLLPTETLPENPFTEVYLDVRRAQVNLGRRFAWHPKHDARLDLTYNHHSFSQPLSEAARDVREAGFANDTLLEYTHHARLDRRLTFTAGAVAWHVTGQLENPTLSRGPDGEAVEYDIYSRPANPDPWQSIPAYSELWGSGYAQAEWYITPRSTLFLGAQANKVDRLPWDVVPRGGVIAEPVRGLHLKVLYGEAFRSPSFFEREFRHPLGIGNPELGPERIGTLEALALYEHHGAAVALSAFSSQERGLIVRTPLPEGRQLLVNKARLRSRGAELEVRVPALHNILLIGSAAYNSVQDENGRGDVFGLPRYMVKAGIAYSPLPSLDFGWFNSYFGEGDTFEGSVVPRANPSPSPFVFGTLKAAADASKLLELGAPARLRIFAYGSNLYDARVYYPEYALKLINSIPGRGGRTVLGGFELTL
jgi:outer membrane receptor protein involved in Fe transport